MTDPGWYQQHRSARAADVIERARRPRVSGCSPDWYQAHTAALADCARAEVGQIVWTGAEVQSLVRRVHARAVSLKRDIDAWLAASGPLSTSPTTQAARDWATSWRAWFQAWNSYRLELCDETATDPCASMRSLLDRIGWGGTATQVQRYDAELDQWRAEFATRSGITPSSPTTSDPPQVGPLLTLASGGLMGSVLTAAAVLAAMILLRR